ncbi:50S ribosomal protein L15 [Candidatus Saccharibacteria bacterium]|nr:50S ribosomal protein L15 [Candidatus Saccharibacteria bacterium]
MKYNELTLNRQKKKSQVGRGISAGRGKTAGRGTKGQGSRKSSIKTGFEGGQIPLVMRIPKLRGFKSHRYLPENVYTGQLDQIKKATIDNQAMYDGGFISSPYVKVKLILRGELTSKKEVKLQSASQKAIEAIEKAGGSFSPIARTPRPSQKSKKT